MPYTDEPTSAETSSGGYVDTIELLSKVSRSLPASMPRTIPTKSGALSVTERNKLQIQHPYFKFQILQELQHADLVEISITADFLLSHQAMLPDLFDYLKSKKKLRRIYDYKAPASMILLEKNGTYSACLLGPKIGEGAHGVIKVGYNLLTGQKQAIKIDRETRRNHNYACKLFHTEKNGLLFFNRYQGELVRKHPSKIYLAEDFIEGQTVEDCLQTIKYQRGIFISAEEAYLKAMRLMLVEMEAIQNMHDQHAIHRDLKNNNLMITNGDTCEIIDLDSFTSGASDETIPQLDYIFSLQSSMAPEITQEEKNFTKASDIYSMGIALQEIVDTMNRSFLPKIKNQELRMQLKQLSASIIEPCITQMQADDPNMRPTAAQISKILSMTLTQAKQLTHEVNNPLILTPYT